MFRKTHAPAREEICPKCGHAGVVADSCPRCRVKVSTYRIHLTAVGREAPTPAPRGRKRPWFKRLFMMASRGAALPAGDQRSKYEQLILRRIYRELEYPQTTRGIYVVLLRLDLTPTGRPTTRRLAVYPPNSAVASSVQTAVSRAQPFPLPPLAGRRNKERSVSLALTVSI